MAVYEDGKLFKGIIYSEEIFSEGLVGGMCGWRYVRVAVFSGGDRSRAHCRGSLVQNIKVFPLITYSIVNHI